MRINSNSNTDVSQSIDGASKTGSSKNVNRNNQAGSSQAKGASAINISEDAKLMQNASDIAKSSPDMNLAKVDELKQRIQQGTFRVDADKLADKLLDDHLTTHFGKNQL